MALYWKQFDPALDVEDAPPPRRTLIVASTPRSGSHILGHMLMATGRLGVPFEYCQPSNLAEWQRRLGSRGLLDTLAALQRRRTTPTGIFAIKLHYDQTRQFGRFRRLLEAFEDPHFVFLRRCDVLAQAVSLAKAQQTGVFIHGQEGTGREAVYDADRIEACLRATVRDNAAWTYALAKHRCPVLTVDFERARTDAAATIASIASFLGVTVPEARLPETPTTVRQSDGGEADAWIRRFSGEAADTRLEDPDLARNLRRLRRRAVKPLRRVLAARH